ncbi:MAG: hypothetical protein ACQSGP_10810, partial [Frankia sp.]
MRIVGAWLRVDLRLRWRSLAALTMLIAIATGAVLAATAGARRGESAPARLSGPTLPADATVLPNQPGFDWNRIRSLPEVAAVAEIAITEWTVEGLPPGSEAPGFPLVGNEGMRSVERPVVLSGRMFDPARPDEAVVTPVFVEKYHHGVGDAVTARLYTPGQVDGALSSDTPVAPAGPRQVLRIVGVVRSPWYYDQIGSDGGIQPTPAFTARYRANLLGSTQQIYVNAMIRLRHGEADVPLLVRDVARVTGRHDIDVWNNADFAR